MSLGSLNNIYTGWDFIDEINPISIFSFGWFDDSTSTTNDSYQFDVYYGGWNNPVDTYNVIANGWFSASASNLSAEISRKYTAGWIPYEQSSIFTNGWFATSAVSVNVNIDLNKFILSLNLKELKIGGVIVSLDKLVLNMFLKELTVYGWGRFKSFLNKTDLRNINSTVDVKKSSILFEPTGNDLNNSNFGSW